MEYLTGQQEKEAIGWMRSAAHVAEKALCLETKCGTVIVCDSEIIGEGYNAPPLDKKEGRICGNEPGPSSCVHAEWRAIMSALKSNPEKIQGSKLYFVRVDENGNIKKSGKPYCTVCSRLALDASIATFALWHEEGIIEYPNDEYNKLSYQSSL
jgi:deoxycytidylate deaminase